MKRFRHWLKTLRAVLLGNRIRRTADRHEEAANRLDAALRKVLKK